MATRRAQSWTEVEEMMQMDVAVWKSAEARPEEYRELVEGASVKFMDSGVATIYIGTLEWKLTPTWVHCQNNDDWFLGTDCWLRVALRAPHGRGDLEVFPCSDVVSSDKLGVDDKLNDMLTWLFSSEERGISSTFTSALLGRTGTQAVKRVESGKDQALGPPLLRCVKGLQNATCVSDVLDTVLGFSAAFASNQQAQIQQAADESDPIDDGYFYDKEVMEEERLFHATRRNGSLWLRQQVRDAATECQAAADAASEVAKLSAEILAKAFRGTCIGNILETSELIQLNPNNSSSRLHFGNRRNHDNHRSSWESVQAKTNGRSIHEAGSEDEDDILGAEVSEARSLDMMLRGRDPSGNRGCSHLINQYLSLELSSSDHHEHNAAELETPRSTVLQRLASWSSSDSGRSERYVTASGTTPAAMLGIRKMQLESLVEEPACNSEIARLCSSFVRQAAAKGDVLQWCSCKFNKSRSAVDMKFQVGSFMEDDIATLSTGINRSSPLLIEIFLDPCSIYQSLITGDVRVSVKQSASDTRSTSSVIGVSCYIPHLVRQYLKQLHHAQAKSTNIEYAEGGQLLTGLMKHVVAKLVFMKTSCCVCDRADMSTESLVPRPCERNLCQALHKAWLVVAPQMVLEQFTVELWLRSRSRLKESSEHSDEFGSQDMLEYVDAIERVSFAHRDRSNRRSLLGIEEMVDGSWLRLIKYSATKPDEELEFRARLLAVLALDPTQGCN